MKNLIAFAIFSILGTSTVLANSALTVSECSTEILNAQKQDLSRPQMTPQDAQKFCQCSVPELNSLIGKNKGSADEILSRNKEQTNQILTKCAQKVFPENK